MNRKGCLRRPSFCIALRPWHLPIVHSSLGVVGKHVDRNLERIIGGVHRIIGMRFRMRIFYCPVNVVVLSNFACKLVQKAFEIVAPWSAVGVAGQEAALRFGAADYQQLGAGTE